MNRAIVAALAVVLVAQAGYAASDPKGPAGEWRGIISEKDKDTQVGLYLQVTAETVEGRFTVLTETGQDIEKGMTFPIVQGKRSGDDLKFFVALVGGRVDSDALFFELKYQDETLEGTAHENRPGSPLIQVRFTRPDRL